MKRKILIIGFDGMTPQLLEKWVSEGCLPNFEKIMMKGVYRRLKSTPNYNSASAWTSFITGKNPAKHGIYYFTKRSPESNEITWLKGSEFKGIPFWKYLNNRGYKAGIHGIPITYPAEKIDGFQVSGWLSPSSKADGVTYPENLMTKIEDKFGPYIFAPSVRGEVATEKYEKAIHSLEEYDQYTFSVARYLFETQDWDLFCTVFLSPDQVSHYFWHLMDEKHPQYDKNVADNYGSAIFEVYKRMDTYLGYFIDKMTNDTSLMILSDHGFGPNTRNVIHLPDFLRICGLLKYSDSKKKKILNKMLISLFAALKGSLSRRIKRVLIRLFPALLNKTISTRFFGNIDWKHTKAYSFNGIWVNLKGREPHGIVDKSEYDNLRNYIIDRLMEAVDYKTGKKLVRTVLKREDVYHGPYLNDAPDLHVIWKDDVVISGLTLPSDKSGEFSKPFEPDDRTGNHKQNGIFLAYGDGIARGAKLEKAEIIDLPPTILHAFNMHIPDDMDGQVMKEIFEYPVSESDIRYMPADKDGDKRVNVVTGEQEEEIKRHLKDLGYM